MLSVHAIWRCVIKSAGRRVHRILISRIAVVTFNKNQFILQTSRWGHKYRWRRSNRTRFLVEISLSPKLINQRKNELERSTSSAHTRGFPSAHSPKLPKSGCKQLEYLLADTRYLVEAWRDPSKFPNSGNWTPVVCHAEGPPLLLCVFNNEQCQAEFKEH